MKLKSIDVDGFETITNAAGSDIRRDLHTFIRYVAEKGIKRSHRGNLIPKADLLRLQKQMSRQDSLTESGSAWIRAVDHLALDLDFIHYDTKGEYAGYSSREASYPDNQIEVQSGRYDQFLALSLQDQENTLLNGLLQGGGGASDHEKHEFMHPSPLGRLDQFDCSGCAIGVLPTLDFAEIRRFLLNLLATLPTDTWWSTQSLIEELKDKHPYFLIPKIVHFKNTYERNEGRYGNFSEYEGDRYYGTKIQILVKDPDAFERVEGRYLERFLESIPLMLGYVDVAYRPKSKNKFFPSRGELVAFRVRGRLPVMLNKEIREPLVRVEPNFEVYIESELYPARILCELAPFAEIVKQGPMTVLRLNKAMATVELARHRSIRLTEYLGQRVSSPLSQNVITELQSWGEHAQVFTLFTGAGLLEMAESAEKLKAIEPHLVKNISSRFSIISAPQGCLEKLLDAELVPISLKHANMLLNWVPAESISVFPKKKTAKSVITGPKQVNLKTRTLVTHYFPSQELYDVFLKGLIQKRCAFKTEKSELAITFSGKMGSHIRDIKKEVSDRYHINYEEMD
ncbi:hypothetical protein WDW37_13035 [Bdellovibrionota bacterium FG-1]